MGSYVQHWQIYIRSVFLWKLRKKNSTVIYRETHLVFLLMASQTGPVHPHQNSGESVAATCERNSRKEQANGGLTNNKYFILNLCFIVLLWWRSPSHRFWFSKCCFDELTLDSPCPCSAPECNPDRKCRHRQVCSVLCLNGPIGICNKMTKIIFKF